MAESTGKHATRDCDPPDPTSSEFHEDSQIESLDELMAENLVAITKIVVGLRLLFIIEIGLMVVIAGMVLAHSLHFMP